MRVLYTVITLLVFLTNYGQKVTTMNKGRVAAKRYNQTIPYIDVRGLVLIDAVINGKTYKFMLDTGAITAISPRLYNELNLARLSSLEVEDSSDLKDNLDVVTMPDIRIGELNFTNVPAVVTSDGPMLQCLGIDGFLGSNLMRNSVVRFSGKSKTVTFYDNIRYTGLKSSEGYDLLKDKMQSNPYLKVRLLNDSIVGSETLLFDSGMTGFYDLSIRGYEEVFKNHGIFKVLNSAEGATSLGIHGVENSTAHYRLLLPELQFAGTSFNAITTTTTSDNISRVGSELLKYGDVIIDYPKRKFYFIPYEEKSISLAEKSWPVQPVLKDNRFVVGMVWDESLRGEIHNGDEILRFGNIDYSQIEPCDIIKNVVRPDGEEADIVLKSADGKEKTIRLKKV